MRHAHAPAAALAALVSLAAALAAAPRLAAQSRVQIELSPFGGETFFLPGGPSALTLERPKAEPQIVTAPRFEDTWSAGLTAGVRLSEAFALEGLFTWTPTWLDGSNFEDGTDVYAYTYALSAVGHLPMAGRLHPFAGLGLGGELDDFSGSIHSHAHWMAALQGGLSYELGEGRSLRVQARDFVSPFESTLPGVGAGWQSSVMVSAGVTWRIPLHQQRVLHTGEWLDFEPRPATK